ncbi:restriction endonuclease subunit S [Acinetobacter faecalis]|nr:restriction endonuclease subunit S [Acinetobacter faecalis]MDY6468665.1 restriction endonuclease subunit S [Acinetobacter faecalis]
MAVPKLRFKEFDGTFFRSSIKELAKIHVGRDLVEDAYSPIKTETHIYPIYSNSVDKEGLYGYYNFEEFNFDNDALTVVGRGAGLGKAFYRQGSFGTIGRLLCLTPKNKSFHPKYLSDYINAKLIIHNESGGIPQLPRSSLENYEVVLPSYEEQKKTATFLSAVDEKIAQLSQKLHLLGQYKQGMMQKLFSQQIRFKADDGSEFGEWEETILSDIVNLFHGYQFRTSDFTSKGIAVIKIGNVIGNNLDLANLTYINENRLEDFKKFEILNGDILMSLTGNIGRIIEVKNKPFIILQNYRVGKFIPLNENFLIKPFLKYLLTSDLVFGRFSQLANQSAQANFGKQDMDKIAVFYPSVSEQTKIANFLSSIDQKIDVVSGQLEQAKLWKKGLLQQMFV